MWLSQRANFPGGWVAGAILRLGAAVRRGSSRGLELGGFDPTASAGDLDRLWQASKGGYRSAVVRNAPYLAWRFAPKSANGAYLWIGVRRRGTLEGVLVLRRPRADGDDRLGGIRVATIADLQYPVDQPATGLALLGAAERAARALGADAILAMTPLPALRSLLSSEWYVPISGNVHFMFRDVAAEKARFAETLGDWWITRGDGQADEAF